MTERQNGTRWCRLYPLIALVCGLGVSAEESGEQTLDEIVVTATRIESSVRDVPRSISLVRQERIQNATQQLGIDEALAAVPGLYMQNRYNFSQDLRVSLRGFGARSSFGIRGIRIYVDGIPETLPDGQGQVDSIDLGSTSRIEVLRGPASSLYGNASGGVIAVETELADIEPFVEVGLAAGELGFQRYHVKSGGSFDTADYLFNVSTQTVDGYRDHSKMRGHLLNGKVGIALNERDKLTVAVNHTDQPESLDAGGIDAAQAAAEPRSARDVNVDFNAGEELSQQRLGFIYERPRAAGELMLRNYYVWRDFGNQLPFVDGGAVDLQRFFWGLGAQYTFADRLPEALGLTVGFDVDRQDDDRKRFDNLQGVNGTMVFDQEEKVDSSGVYVQGRYAMSKVWTLSAGLRYDEVTFEIDDRYLQDGDDSGRIEFSEVSPSIGIDADLGEHIVFATFSSAFETPTTTELANPDASGGFNLLLRPQLADNYELGIKGSRFDTFYELSVFRIDIEDELVPFELQAFPGRTFYQNAGTSDRSGVEAALAWQGDSGWAADLSWTWSDFTFDEFRDDDGNDFGGKELPGLPEHFAYAGLSYDSDSGWHARLEAIYSGSLYADNANAASVDSYVVANFRASRAYRSGPWLVRPYVGINNLFDERYNSNIRINAFGARYYEPAPDRNIYAGIDVRYGGH